MRWLGEPGRVVVVIAVAAWSGACSYERPDDVPGDAGAGGGGGGAGYVYIRGALQQPGAISPAPDVQ